MFGSRCMGFVDLCRIFLLLGMWLFFVLAKGVVPPLWLFLFVFLEILLVLLVQGLLLLACLDISFEVLGKIVFFGFNLFESEICTKNNRTKICIIMNIIF